MWIMKSKKKKGCPVRSIFEQKGEEAFRRMESQVLLGLSSQSGALISTGGGIILLQNNVDRMKKTGKIVWIRRPVETILAGVNARVRPLIKDNPQKLLDIYAEREPLYRRYADFIVDNTESLDDAAEAIVKLYLQR